MEGTTYVAALLVLCVAATLARPESPSSTASGKCTRAHVLLARHTVNSLAMATNSYIRGMHSEFSKVVIPEQFRSLDGQLNCPLGEEYGRLLLFRMNITMRIRAQISLIGYFEGPLSRMITRESSIENRPSFHAQFMNLANRMRGTKVKLHEVHKTLASCYDIPEEDFTVAKMADMFFSFPQDPNIQCIPYADLQEQVVLGQLHIVMANFVVDVISIPLHV